MVHPRRYPNIMFALLYSVKCAQNRPFDRRQKYVCALSLTKCPCSFQKCPWQCKKIAAYSSLHNLFAQNRCKTGFAKSRLTFLSDLSPINYWHRLALYWLGSFSYGSRNYWRQSSLWPVETPTEIRKTKQRSTPGVVWNCPCSGAIHRGLI